MDQLRSKLTDHLRSQNPEDIWNRIKSGFEHIKNKNSPQASNDSGDNTTDIDHCPSHAQEQDPDYVARCNPKSLRYWKLTDSYMKLSFVKALLYGLQVIPRRGSPGILTETGSDTFHVSLTAAGDSIESAGLYGSGRVVVFGHNSYIVDLKRNPSSDLERRTNRIVLNAVFWSTSSECQITDSDSSSCRAICERNTDITSYPLNWGKDCQQPIVISGLGFSDGKFTEVFEALQSSADEPDVLVAGAVQRKATLENIQALIAARPDLILWTNSDTNSEKLFDTDGSSDFLDLRAELLLNYIQQGGAVVLAICPWGWESLANVSVAESSLFSRVLSAIGINISNAIANFPGDGVDVDYSLKAAALPAMSELMANCTNQIMTQANIEIDDFKKLADTYLACPSSVFMKPQRPARGWLPDTDVKMKEVMSKIEAIALNIGQHSLAFPLATGKGASTLTQANAAAMLYLIWLRRRAETTPPKLLSSITPGIETFPGQVGGGPRNTGMVVSLLSMNKKWQTVPIYAPPGEPITLTVSDQTLSAYPSLSLSVQIGTHTDSLALIKDNYKLARHPRIVNKRTWTPREVTAIDENCLARPATRSNSIQIGSVYGGIVYIQIQNHATLSAADGGPPPLIVVNVEGGVPIPHYSYLKEVRNMNPADVLYNIFDDSTDTYPYWSSTWEQRVSQFIDAPWTDLEGRYLIMTLPVSVVQDFSSAEIRELVDFWDEVVYNELYLSGDLFEFDFTQERLTCDQQISAGYMHSGYPVMCFTDIITRKVDSERPQLLNVAELRIKPFWGIYHEIGHNRQKSAWTWREMTEVTVNIFSLYSCFKSNGHTAYETPWYKEQIPHQLKFLKNEDSTYKDLIANAGIALGAFAVFIQSIAQDWEIVRQIFQVYRDQKINPSGENNQINEWIKQTSLAVNLDLRPYYEQWKWPINDAYLENDLDGLPKWTGDVAQILESSQN